MIVKFFKNKEKADLRVQLSTFVGGLFEQVRHSVSVGFRSLRESTTLLQPIKRYIINVNSLNVKMISYLCIVQFPTYQSKVS